MKKFKDQERALSRSVLNRNELESLISSGLVSQTCVLNQSLGADDQEEKRVQTRLDKKSQETEEGGS